MSQRKRASTGDYLSPLDFAETVDLSRETVYRLISRGRLKAVKLGSTLRLPRAQLETMLANGGHATR